MLQQNRLVTGKRPALKTKAGVANRNDRVFKRGSLMFIEGESGREMFIMRTGKVRILKQEGDKTVELAVLGPGSVLGELSLLDNQPRGATAQVTEEVMATVIDEKILELTLTKIPPWLVSIIKIVVGRLRETNRRNGDDIVKTNLPSLINVLLILKNKGVELLDGKPVVAADWLKEEMYSVTGVSEGQTEKILTILLLKEFLVIDEDDNGKEYIRILNPTALQMYMTYLRVKMRGGKMVGEDISDAALDMGNAILKAAENGGRKEPDGKTVVGIPQLELQVQKENKGRFIDPTVIDELVSAKIIQRSAMSSTAMGGASSKGAIIFDESKLQRILYLRRMIPKFKEEVIF